MSGFAFFGNTHGQLGDHKLLIDQRATVLFYVIPYVVHGVTPGQVDYHCSSTCSRFIAEEKKRKLLTFN